MFFVIFAVVFTIMSLCCVSICQQYYLRQLKRENADLRRESERRARELVAKRAQIEQLKTNFWGGWTGK